MLRNTPGLFPGDARIMPPPPSVIPTKNVSRHCHIDSGGQNHPLVRTAALETMTSETLLSFTVYLYVVAVVTQSCPTRLNSMGSRTPGLPDPRQLMESDPYVCTLETMYCLVLLFSDFVESNHTAYIFLWLFKINIIFVKCNHCVLYTVVQIHYF